MERINLTKRLKPDLFYDRDRDIQIARIWGNIKSTLESLERSDLFEAIRSINVTDNSVVITTLKPIVNAEFKLYRESIGERLKKISAVGTRSIIFR